MIIGLLDYLKLVVTTLPMLYPVSLYRPITPWKKSMCKCKY